MLRKKPPVPGDRIKDEVDAARAWIAATIENCSSAKADAVRIEINLESYSEDSIASKLAVLDVFEADKPQPKRILLPLGGSLLDPRHRESQKYLIEEQVKKFF